MNEHDKAFVIVTKGALVRKNEEFIRKYFVQENLLDAVISLPSASNSGRSVPIELLIIQKNLRERLKMFYLQTFQNGH